MTRTDWFQRRVIKEGAWSRIYEADDGAQVHVSKFVTDKIEIDPEFVKRQWVSWKDPERIAFAHAFASKPTLSSKDEQILDFLMQDGEERIWVSIAPALPKHSQRKRILEFLLHRLNQGVEPKANYIHALAVLGDLEAVPALRSMHDRLHEGIKKVGNEAHEQSIFDFVCCCAALRNLENSSDYQGEIKAFLNHPSPAVRSFSRMWLEGGPPTR